MMITLHWDDDDYDVHRTVTALVSSDSVPMHPVSSQLPILPSYNISHTPHSIVFL
jgi:hypothetical protein